MLENGSRIKASDWAYLAGLIDAEGCIGLHRVRKKAIKPGNWEIRFNAQVAIYMCDPLFIYQLAKDFSFGRVVVRPQRHSKWKKSAEWRFGSNCCREILPKILPYLRVKKQEAKMLMEYLSLAKHIPRRVPAKLIIYRERVLDLEQRLHLAKQLDLYDPNFDIDKPSKEDMAYLAGMIDGDGYIGIVRHKQKHPKPNQWGSIFNPRITICLCQGNVLREFAHRTGLGQAVFRSAQQEGWRSQILWNLSSNACRTLLPQVLPYLLHKNKQAHLVLDYLDMAIHKGIGGASKRKQYRLDVETIYYSLRNLNKKGVA